MLQNYWFQPHKKPPRKNQILNQIKSNSDKTKNFGNFKMEWNPNNVNEMKMLKVNRRKKYFNIRRVGTTTTTTTKCEWKCGIGKSNNKNKLQKVPISSRPKIMEMECAIGECESFILWWWWWCWCWKTIFSILKSRDGTMLKNNINNEATRATSRATTQQQ